MIDGLLTALYAWRLRRALAEVRTNMAALGFSIDDLTDEQIMDRTARVGAAMRRAGISSEQLINVLRIESANAGEIARSDG